MSRCPPLPQGYDTGTGWAEDGQVIDTFQIGGLPGISWASYVVRYWRRDYYHVDQPVVATVGFTVERRPSSVRGSQPYTLDVGNTLTHLTPGELERVAKAEADKDGRACIFLAQQRLSLHLNAGNLVAIRQAAQKALDFVPVPEAPCPSCAQAKAGDFPCPLHAPSALEVGAKRDAE